MHNLLQTNQSEREIRQANSSQQTDLDAIDQHNLAVINPKIWYHMIRDGVPYEFCPDLSQRATRIESFQSREERNLKKRNESSKQRDGDHHASNQEHDNPWWTQEPPRQSIG